MNGCVEVFAKSGHLQASFGRDQLTDLHCVVGGWFSRFARKKKGLASFRSKLDVIVEAGFLYFTSFSEEVFLV